MSRAFSPSAKILEYNYKTYRDVKGNIIKVHRAMDLRLFKKLAYEKKRGRDKLGRLGNHP